MPRRRKPKRRGISYAYLEELLIEARKKPRPTPEQLFADNARFRRHHKQPVWGPYGDWKLDNNSSRVSLRRPDLSNVDPAPVEIIRPPTPPPQDPVILETVKMEPGVEMDVIDLVNYDNSGRSILNRRMPTPRDSWFNLNSIQRPGNMHRDAIRNMPSKRIRRGHGRSQQPTQASSDVTSTAESESDVVARERRRNVKQKSERRRQDNNEIPNRQIPAALGRAPDDTPIVNDEANDSNSSTSSATPSTSSGTSSTFSGTSGNPSAVLTAPDLQLDFTSDEDESSGSGGSASTGTGSNVSRRPQINNGPNNMLDQWVIDVDNYDNNSDVELIETPVPMVDLCEDDDDIPPLGDYPVLHEQFGQSSNMGAALERDDDAPIRHEQDPHYFANEGAVGGIPRQQFFRDHARNDPTVDHLFNLVGIRSNGESGGENPLPRRDNASRQIANEVGNVAVDPYRNFYHNRVRNNPIESRFYGLLGLQNHAERGNENPPPRRDNVVLHHINDGPLIRVANPRHFYHNRVRVDPPLICNLVGLPNYDERERTDVDIRIAMRAAHDERQQYLQSLHRNLFADPNPDPPMPNPNPEDVHGWEAAVPRSVRARVFNDMLYDPNSPLRQNNVQGFEPPILDRNAQIWVQQQVRQEHLRRAQAPVQVAPVQMPPVPVAPPTPPPAHQGQLNNPGENVENSEEEIFPQFTHNGVAAGASCILFQLIHNTTFPHRYDRSIREESCRVCLNAIENNANARRLPCWHVFHVECVDRWLACKTTCPICRTSITLSAREHMGFVDSDVVKAEAHLSAILAARAHGLTDTDDEPANDQFM